jgi:hypothetical protein
MILTLCGRFCGVSRQYVRLRWELTRYDFLAADRILIRDLAAGKLL